MQKNMWKIFVITLVSVGGVFGARVYQDYKNSADVVRPVYDSMRTSLRQDTDSSLNMNEVMPKKRVPRSSAIPLNHNYDEVVRRNSAPYDQAEYYDTQASDSNNDWAVVNSQGYPFSDLVCTRRSEAQTHITVSEPNTASSVPFWNIALLAKYAFFLFAAFWAKALLFKFLIIPLKVLIGLKAISVINSLLLGALLYKSKHRRLPLYPLPPYPFTTVPTGAAPATAAAAAAPAAAASSASSSAASDPYDDEYVDVVRPGEDLKRILEYVKKRNKNW